MASRVTIKIGEGIGPHVPVHDGEWDLELSGFTSGEVLLRVEQAGNVFIERAITDNSFVGSPRSVKLVATSVGDNFIATLVRRADAASTVS